MQHKIVFVIVVLAIVAGVWYGLAQSGEPAPLLTTTTPDGSPVSQQNADQEIIGTLLALRAVTLSGTIFGDPSFMSLQDFGTPIVPEPVGRENPFAPLGAPAVVAPAQSAAGASQAFTPRGQ